MLASIKRTRMTVSEQVIQAFGKEEILLLLRKALESDDDNWEKISIEECTFFLEEEDTLIWKKS